MTPYYEHGGIVIYHGDCRGILRHQTTKPVRLILTDPPYGIQFLDKPTRFHGGTTLYSPVTGDDVIWDIHALLGLFDCTKLIFGGNYYNLPRSRGWIVWDKQGPEKSIDFGDGELIWTNVDRPLRILRHIWDGFRRDSARRLAQEVLL